MVLNLRRAATGESVVWPPRSVIACRRQIGVISTFFRAYRPLTRHLGAVACVTGPCAVGFSGRRRHGVVDGIKSRGALDINKEGGGCLWINKEGGGGLSCFRSKGDAALGRCRRRGAVAGARDFGGTGGAAGDRGEREGGGTGPESWGRPPLTPCVINSPRRGPPPRPHAALGLHRPPPFL